MTTKRPELERPDSLEVTSSEEIYKRRKSKSGQRDRSAKKIKSDVHQQSMEELDDGVTKSIYDMYYRHKPRESPFRMDNNENIPRKNTKRPQNFRENVRSVRKGHVTKRRQEKGASYFADGSYEMEKKGEKPNERRSHRTMRRNYSDEHSGESEDSGDVEKGVRRRRKRTLSSKSERETSAEDEASQDTEYIITLRPTQIRTFVIWFQPEKKYK